MIYRAPQEADFLGMQALDLELALTEDPKFDQLPERERAGRLRTSLASLRFFARSEHSFVAIDASSADDPEATTVLGLILAQSVWMGDKPVVWISALRVHPDAPNGTLPGLLHASVKSAYDTAVYEVHMAADRTLWPFAQREGFKDAGLKHVVRYLGTRANTAPGADEDP
jgi:Protein of unknown function (DUF1999)